MKAVTAIAVCTLAAVAWAQNDDKMTARQIFDLGIKTPPPVKHNPPAKTVPGNPPKPVADPPLAPPVVVSNGNPKAPDDKAHVLPAGYAPLALKYSILQRKGEAYQEVDSDTEFHTGDHVRVKVEANQVGYLYILLFGSSGEWNVLFPSDDIDGGRNQIEPGRAYTIPPERGFFFDGPAGVERVSLVFTRQPEPDFDKLFYGAHDPKRTDDGRKLLISQSTPVDGAVLVRLHYQLLSRDLVFDSSDSPDG